MSDNGFSFEPESPRPPRLRRDLTFLEDGIADNPWAPKPAPIESKTPRFIVSSLIAHAALVGGLLTLSAPMLTPPVAETVTIDLADSSAPAPVGEGAAAPAAAQAPSQTAFDASVPLAPGIAEAPISASEPTPPVASASARQDEVAALPPKRAVKAPARAVRSAPKPTKASVTAKAPPPATDAGDVEVPEKIDQVDSAQELDETQFEAKTVGALNEGDLEQKFAKVDHAQARDLRNAQDEIAQETDQSEQQDLSALEAADQDAQAEASRLAERAEDLKKRNAQAIAVAQANEAAARDRAAKQAAAAAAAGAAAGHPRGTEGASGKGGSGGAPNAVRTLEDLRQMPGNPKPSYSKEERIARQQGDVVFLAYVGQEGRPLRFQQVKTTGYENLDRKTLEALKKWKFYPGQEGWVEIPFHWDLRGGPQEMSALSKRYSRN